MPALIELEQAWLAARADPSFQERLSLLLETYVGRPSPLYFAERLSETAGHPIYRRADPSETITNLPEICADPLIRAV